jgi:hypothetical protein
VEKIYSYAARENFFGKRISPPPGHFCRIGEGNRYDVEKGKHGGQTENQQEHIVDQVDDAVG